MFQEHLEKLLTSGYKLIALETGSPEKSINDFRPLVREGKAIYLWENNTGLRRMEASHISIPNTQTPEMVINHIKQKKIYGIYLLIGFGKELSKKNLNTALNEIISDKDSDSVIIFIDNNFDYPHKLMGDILIAQEPDIRDRTLINQLTR